MTSLLLKFTYVIGLKGAWNCDILNRRGVQLDERVVRWASLETVIKLFSYEILKENPWAKIRRESRQQDYFSFIFHRLSASEKASHAAPFIVLVVSNALFWYYMKNSLGNRSTLKEYAVYKDNAVFEWRTEARIEHLGQGTGEWLIFHRIYLLNTLKL